MKPEFSNAYVISVMGFYSMTGFLFGGGMDMLTEMGKGIFYTVHTIIALAFIVLQIKELWIPMFTREGNEEG